MAGFQNQLRKAQRINPERLEKDLYKFVRSIEDVFLDLSKARISIRSEDIFGKPIGFYSTNTQFMSGGKKKAGDPFTGIDTGDWFKGFFMSEVSGILIFGSTDPKTHAILLSEDWLSDDLFGLTDKELKKVIAERLLPFFIKNSRILLGI